MVRKAGVLDIAYNDLPLEILQMQNPNPDKPLLLESFNGTNYYAIIADSKGHWIEEKFRSFYLFDKEIRFKLTRKFPFVKPFVGKHYEVNLRSFFQYQRSVKIY